MWILYITLAAVLVIGFIISLIFSIRTLRREGGLSSDWAAMESLGHFFLGMLITCGICCLLCGIWMIVYMIIMSI